MEIERFSIGKTYPTNLILTNIPSIRKNDKLKEKPLTSKERMMCSWDK